MSRATSIAGVRPLGWLARVRAHNAQWLGEAVSRAVPVAWRMARALRVWGQSRRWATGRAMIMRVSARGRIPLHAPEAGMAEAGELPRSCEV
jgi:hypothetical protein